MKKVVMLCLCLLLFGCAPTSKTKVRFVLDWAPNTNHTGLFVAKSKGYFDKIGVDFEIVQPPEGSSSEMVAINNAQFGISFQDSLAHRFDKKMPLIVVAAIVEHNTSGIMSNASLNIKSPSDLKNLKYGTWNDPIELKMIEQIVGKSQYETLKLIPNEADVSVLGIVNNQFDAAWVYYGWDGIRSEVDKLQTNFFFLKDYDKTFDYYSPVIIANKNYAQENSELTRKIMQAIKQGYIDAIKNPSEAADILIQNNPELKSQAEFIKASQKYLSSQYASQPEKWGLIEQSRWSAYYKWINDHQLTSSPLDVNAGFSNEWIK